MSQYGDYHHPSPPAIVWLWRKYLRHRLGRLWLRRGRKWRLWRRRWLKWDYFRR